MNRRAVIFWLGLAIAIVVIGGLSGGRRVSGRALDPESTDPSGTRGLVLFLEELGSPVIDGLPDAGTGVVLVLSDRLTDEQAWDLDDWVDAGGTIVVTDIGSPYTTLGRLDVTDSYDVRSDTLESGDCAITDLADLELAAPIFQLADNDLSSSGFCFGSGGRSYVSEFPFGAGRIITVGGPLPFTNEFLDEADNAVLAARLLAPGETYYDGPTDDATVALLFDPVDVAGSRGLGDLIPSGAKWATWQLIVAFAAFALWKAVRFGRPVGEPQPVELPGSLLVRATGELHRRTGGHAKASETLRGHLERRLRRHLRATDELPIDDLVRNARGREGVDRAALTRALTGPNANDAQSLSELTADIDEVNRELLSEQQLVESQAP